MQFSDTIALLLLVVSVNAIILAAFGAAFVIWVQEKFNKITKVESDNKELRQQNKCAIRALTNLMIEVHTVLEFAIAVQRMLAEHSLKCGEFKALPAQHKKLRARLHKATKELMLFTPEMAERTAALQELVQYLGDRGTLDLLREIESEDLPDEQISKAIEELKRRL
jgi:hypothetical protein